MLVSTLLFKNGGNWIKDMSSYSSDWWRNRYVIETANCRDLSRSISKVLCWSLQHSLETATIHYSKMPQMDRQNIVRNESKMTLIHSFCLQAARIFEQIKSNINQIDSVSNDESPSVANESETPEVVPQVLLNICGMKVWLPLVQMKLVERLERISTILKIISLSAMKQNMMGGFESRKKNISAPFWMFFFIIQTVFHNACWFFKNHGSISAIL